ncbi:hypothetical protein ACFWZ2_26980 [Streptomyces sp. NPDC059002]|uniref:hypothetical protein n=1 Tax=Streptomyces sp. NPDC059002 TaxID=3346690 RepID=UPI0036858BE3
MGDKSDLAVDYEVLMRVRHNLDHIADLMKQPGRDMEKVSGDAIGVTELAKRMDDFGDEWSYGIKKLTKFSEKASEALVKIKEAFEKLDHELAETGKKGKGGHGKGGGK